MSVSIFELFSIGIGPSSSHTVGPMTAAANFTQQLVDADNLDKVVQLQVDLYGSLALTGKGHSTDTAILMGLEAERPHRVDPSSIQPRCQQIHQTKQLTFAGQCLIHFDPETDLVFHQQEFLPRHANGMKFSAKDANDDLLLQKTYYSIGGGFVIDDENFDQDMDDGATVAFPFATAKELKTLCEENNLTISELMLKNELHWRSNTEVKTKLLEIADTMAECIQAGIHHTGILPGGLNVKRRAPDLYKKLQEKDQGKEKSEADMFNWLNLCALAVNEENAAGGRIVTAPTNGAAGIIPAVLAYYKNFCTEVSEAGIIEYLLTAGAIAILYKKGASISAAEVGCQGEVGVACSMAAGALAAVLGGSLQQILNAAEIGMEHNLGLTCDPIKGLVQIPCIERNTMGTVQAINAAKLALMENHETKVSLDDVIATMLQTGRDMQNKYKETSQGGLAVNTPEC